MHCLPLEDQQLLEGLGYKDKLIDIDRAILANEFFIQQIVANPAIFAEEDEEEDEATEETNDLRPENLSSEGGRHGTRRRSPCEFLNCIRNI